MKFPIDQDGYNDCDCWLAIVDKAVPKSIGIIDKYIPDKLCQLGCPSNGDELKFEHKSVDEATPL